MQRGGDLHEAEERFFAFAASRSETLVEDWLESLNCPVLRVDGTKAIAQNVDFIVGQVQNASEFTLDKRQTAERNNGAAADLLPRDGITAFFRSPVRHRASFCAGESTSIEGLENSWAISASGL